MNLPKASKEKKAPAIPLNSDKPSLVDRLRLKELPRMITRVEPPPINTSPLCPATRGHHQFELWKRDANDEGRHRCRECRRYKEPTLAEHVQYEIEQRPSYRVRGETFEVPCHLGDCPGRAGWARCSHFEERCCECKRLKTRPESEFGADC